MAAEDRRGGGECVENSDIEKKGIWGGTLKFSRENNFSWKSPSSPSKNVTPLHGEWVTLAFLYSAIHSFVNLSIFLYKYSANICERSQFLHCEELSLAKKPLPANPYSEKSSGSYQDYSESKLPTQERITGSWPRSRSPARSTPVSVWQRFILIVCSMCWCPPNHSLDTSESLVTSSRVASSAQYPFEWPH